MLAHRLRRWTNIKPALVLRHMGILSNLMIFTDVQPTVSEYNNDELSGLVDIRRGSILCIIYVHQISPPATLICRAYFTPSGLGLLYNHGNSDSDFICSENLLTDYVNWMIVMIIHVIVTKSV